MEFNLLSVNGISKVAFTMALLSPTVVNSVNHGKTVAQYVVYRNEEKIVSKATYKKINFQKNINITNILPNSEDFTEEEEEIYSEAANVYYGDNYKNKSLHDIYYG